MIGRPATLRDADDLAPRLRQTDVREIAALSGASPLTALRVSVRRSTEAYAIELAGRVEALYGAEADHFGRGAQVWALGSDLLPERRGFFIKAMKGFLDEAQGRYGRLVNVVDEANAPAIRLLERLGFNFGASLPAPGGGRAVSFWRG